MRLPDPLQKKRQPSPMASVVAAGSRPSRSLSSALLTVRISVTLTTLAFGKPPSPFLSETFTGSFRKIQVRGNEADHCRRNQTSIDRSLCTTTQGCRSAGAEPITGPNSILSTSP